MRNLWQEVQNQFPHISFEDNFLKYFRYVPIKSLKILKFNFSGTISTIFICTLSQWTEDFILHISCSNNFFECISDSHEWHHLEFQRLISSVLLAIFMRSLRQWLEDYMYFMRI